MSTSSPEVDRGLLEGWIASGMNEWFVTDPLSVDIWKHHRLRLRVWRQQDGVCYVGPYDIGAYLHDAHTKKYRVGPYESVEDAQLAAEMIGEIKGEPND